MKGASPLRYPGGKWRLAGYFERLIKTNFESPPKYVEPYCGGGSLALSLLFSGSVSRIQLNDLDSHIFAFWKSVTERTEEFCSLIGTVPVTPREWARQRQLYLEEQSDLLALGFATFFLSRTNHSGILNGGMIGGKDQRGPWKLDARFNKSDLAKRVRRIGANRENIEVTCKDAEALLSSTARQAPDRLIYLDPPYFEKGQELYLNAYRPEDHEAVRSCITRLASPWVVSYDRSPAIQLLYKGYRTRHLQLLHTARSPRVGKEVMYFSPGLKVPQVA